MSMPMSLFGTIPITILRTPGSPAPDWATTLRYKTFAFPGGNKTYTQVFGQGDLTVAHQVRLESSGDLQRLVALLGTRQTLRVPYASTAYQGTREGQEFGELYRWFDRVFLIGVNEVQLRNGGTVTCRCAFTREVPS